MSRTYGIRQFAALGGVSVKALHLYDRRGLLHPQRSASGYRRYADEDLLRLQQIVALKFVGLSLGQIRGLLGRGVLPLREALRAQQAALREQRQRLDRALTAIEHAERSIAGGETSQAAVIAPLMEVLAMPDMSMLKQYFSDDAWTRWTARHATWPSAEWRTLYAEAHECLGEDPDGPRAQHIAARWMALFEAETQGDPEIRTALRKAAGDRQQWASFIQAAMPGVDVKRIGRFIAEAVWSRWEREDGSAGFTPTVRPRASEAQTRTLHALAQLLDHDPASGAVQELVRRWYALIDEQSGGDPDLRRMIRRAGERWREWPAPMRRWVAMTYGMPVETWERVLALIEESGIGNQDSGLGQGSGVGRTPES